MSVHAVSNFGTICYGTRLRCLPHTLATQSQALFLSSYHSSHWTEGLIHGAERCLALGYVLSHYGNKTTLTKCFTALDLFSTMARHLFKSEIGQMAPVPASVSMQIWAPLDQAPQYCCNHFPTRHGLLHDMSYQFGFPTNRSLPNRRSFDSAAYLRCTYTAYS
jgi:hypothetical protein